MLISQTARDTYDNVSERWGALDAWLADPANAAAAAQVSTSIKVFQDHWKEVDDGLLSDSDDVCGAVPDIETAERYAVGVGYTPPVPATALDQGCTVAVAKQELQQAAVAALPVLGPAGIGVVQAGIGVDESCEQDPHQAICQITDPAGPHLPPPTSWIPSWVLWALGLTTLGGLWLVYESGKLAVRAAPAVLPFVAPEAMPFLAALQGARGSAPVPTAPAGDPMQAIAAAFGPRGSRALERLAQLGSPNPEIDEEI